MRGVEAFGDTLMLSSADVVDHLDCTHLTTLNRRAARQGLIPGRSGDPAGLLRADLGGRHRDEHLARLGTGATLTPIPTTGLHEAASGTLAAMQAESPVIVGAVLVHGAAVARVDALVRAPDPHGGWCYEPHDAAIARTDRRRALCHLADAALLLEDMLGVGPDRVHLVGRDGGLESIPASDISALGRRVRARLDAFMVDAPATAAEPCDRCEGCVWRPRCQQEWNDTDAVTQVAGVHGTVVSLLAAHGITTAAQLAAAPDADPPDGLDARTYRRITRQARLQVLARSGPDLVEVLPPYEHPGGGFARLPRPDPADLFFDLEGDPYRGQPGLEYLWGLSDAEDHYRSWWGHYPAAECHAFESVVDLLTDHLASNQRAHVYHYAPYEVDVLRRLAARHSSREDEVDQLLANHRLVDLYRVARQSVATSRPGYGMKELERFYRDRRTTDVQDGLASVIQYERWLETGEDALLDDIEAYNRDDCISTRQLRDWLEERRNEAGERYDGVEVAEIDVDTRIPTSPPRTTRENRLVEHLRASLDDAGERGDPTHRYHTTLLQLLGFHRRQSRRRPQAEVDVDETSSVAADQLDPCAQAVLDMVEAVVTGDPAALAFDTVLRRQPSLAVDLTTRSGRPDEAAERAIEWGRSLDRSYLAIQAPPGTGLGATTDALVQAMIGDGRRVGLCAVDPELVSELEPRPGLVTGSPARFAEPDRRNTLDVLVIIQAGKTSLADVAAVGLSADSLILIGDHAGLDRPRIRGRHPSEARRSVLEHLLDGDTTLSAPNGVFLDVTSRMHPGLCSFVSELGYDGRLRPTAATANMAIEGEHAALGWVPVVHRGNNTTTSPEEVEAVQLIVGHLVGRLWTGADGTTRRLVPDDILVTAPFSEQLGALANALGGDFPVEPAERFGSRSAPVVIRSMAASSTGDIPGGRGRLLSKHRLLGTLLSGQRMAIIVASPRLLDAPCRTVKQLTQINALLRFVELADTLTLAPAQH